MKNKKVNFGGLLIAVAILSFVITFIEGCLYYADYDPMFRGMLIVQNIINTFKFSPEIKLELCIEFINKNGGIFTTVVGYAYAVSIFTAPFCTIAAIYKVLEKVLSIVLDLRKNVNGEKIVIFGYNDDVKAIVRANETYTIHIITREELPSEEKYELVKKGCRIHCANLFTASAKEQKAVLKKARIMSASGIMLMHEVPANNFSLLQLLLSEDSPIPADRSVRVLCKCENDGIRGLRIVRNLIKSRLCLNITAINGSQAI